jgi:hypothetical protein
MAFRQLLGGELQIAFDQAERGEVSAWDIDATLAAVLRRHAEPEP